MAKEDVNIKVTANVAEAIQMWKAMEAGPEGMAKALAGMGQKGEKATKSLGDQISDFATGAVTKWLSVGAAVATVTKLINDQWEAVKRLREEKTATTNSVDEVWTRFQVQSGIKSGPQANAIRSQLFNIIANRKIAPIPGFEAAEQLGSAGASVDDILGGGLDEFLQMVTAANSAGKSVNQGELAKATVLFLKANGLQPNRQGMRGTSLAIQQLFGGTNLQVSNLARFAGEAGTIAHQSHMAPEDQLAQYSMFLDTMEESRAATAFRSGVIRLATAGATPEQTRALGMIGLKPGDVDFQGEDWETVYRRLQKGFSGVPGDKRNIAAKTLFGEEGMGFYDVLLQPGGVEEAKRRGAMARDPSGAAERLATAENSRAAQAREAETRAAQALYNTKEQDPATLRNRLIAMMEVYGLNENQQASLLSEFDDPSGPNTPYAMSNAGRAEHIDKLMRAEMSGRTIGRPAALQLQAELRRQGIDYTKANYGQQLLGQQPLPVKIIGPDGLDVPTEPAATGLSQ